MNLRRIVTIFLPAILCANSVVHARDFYFSPSGNDSSTGDSSATAWKSFSKLGSMKLGPGDRILLQGGATFEQTLSLVGNAHGSKEHPIEIASYGRGRPKIKNLSGDGIQLSDVDGIQIRGLDVSGEDCASQKANPAECQSHSQCRRSHGTGILIKNTRPKVSSENISMSDLDVGGYDIESIESSKKSRGPEGEGIYVESAPGAAGFQNVSVTNSSIHDNARCGIRFTAEYPVEVIKNVQVTNNQVFNNFGVPTMKSTTGTGSGNGILLDGTDGALIQDNNVHHNGCINDEGGNIGIWVYNANNIQIRHNKSWKNSNRGVVDGGGIDFDYHLTNSIVEDNLTHDNSGFGVNFAQPAYGTSDHLIMRNNTSINDGRRNGYGGIGVWGNITNSEITGNKVYVKDSKATANKTPAGIVLLDWTGTNLKVSNNQFVSDGVASHIAILGQNTGKDLIWNANTYKSCKAQSGLIVAIEGVPYTKDSEWRSKLPSNIAGIESDRLKDPLSSVNSKDEVAECSPELQKMLPEELRTEHAQ